MINTRAKQRSDEPTLVDLFAGCGGLSLGFSWAGFDVAASVEADDRAAETHRLNFGDEASREAPEAPRPGRDITDPEQADPTRILELDLGGKRPDVIVGGPPCQAFSRIGRAKLRDEARRSGVSPLGGEAAHLADPRSRLASRYLDFVEVMRPRAILMENVPDMASPGGGHHPVSDVCDRLEGLGYAARFTLLNAVHQGVPQFRERLFILAYREEESPGGTDWWPEIFSAATTPGGYAGSRAVARKAARISRDRRYEDRTEVPLFEALPAPSRLVPVTAREALLDLPRVDPSALGPGRRLLAPSRGDPAYLCSIKAASAYAQLMRRLSTPVRACAGSSVTAHVTRFLPRDFRTFEAMTVGQDYIGNVFGADGERVQSVREVAARIGAEPPPYPEDKFPNKWWKIRPDMPVKTLTAHLGKDCYSHIHHEQGRSITVREAARLQSFPDSFVFAGSMNAGFRMVGNAVPPLLSYAIARQVRSALGCGGQPDIRAVLCGRA